MLVDFACLVMIHSGNDFSCQKCYISTLCPIMKKKKFKSSIYLSDVDEFVFSSISIILHYSYTKKCLNVPIQIYNLALNVTQSFMCRLNSGFKAEK